MSPLVLSYRVTELMKKEPERKQKEAEEKAEKRRLLLEGPRHMFNDQEYIEQLEATQDNFEDALKQGLKSNKGNGVKRKRWTKEKEDEGTKKRGRSYGELHVSGIVSMYIFLRKSVEVHIARI